MRPILTSAKANSAFTGIRVLSGHANPKYVNQACSGKENFVKDFEKSHVKTTPFQKLILGVGSGVISLSSPSRGDMVAVMGEVTGPRALEYMRYKMLESEEGRKIIDEKPRISSATVNLEELKSYPEGTLGRTYSNFLERYGYSPDVRPAVRFVDDVELAYIAQRYREVHDLFHTIFHMPTNMLGEVTVKWVEAIQTKLPMCVSGALFGALRLAPKLTRTYSTKVTLTIDSALDSKIQNNEINVKHHPGIMNLKCVQLPDGIAKSIIVAIEGLDRHLLLKNASVLVRKLLSRDVPLEENSKKLTRTEVYESIKNQFFKFQNSEDLDYQTSKKLENIVNKRLKQILYNWKPMIYDRVTSYEYLILRGAPEYAALKQVFNEILLRDKGFNPERIFDFGSGVGTTIWAANEIWGKSIKQYYCVDASKDMNNLAAKIIQNYSNAPDIKNIYFRQFLPATYMPYDIVVSAFTLFELKNCEERLKVLTNLWNKATRYLVLIEHGTKAGHSLIEEARCYLLETSKTYNVQCHIFAPCPHELPCPRFKALGKFTPCHFKVRYFHVPIPKLMDSAYSEIFSYLILRKGENPPPCESRPARIVRNVLRRHKHTVCHMCTSEGSLETTVVTKVKNGKSLYSCIRKSNWGDIIPEGITLEKTEKLIDRSARYTQLDNNEEDSVDYGELVSDEESDDCSDNETSDANDTLNK